MKKIVTIVGARPQFIKAAVVSRAISQETQLKEILVHTGQHFDTNMSDVFFAELDIHKIDHQLTIGSSIMTQGKQTAEMLIHVENILMQEKPDVVLIYGDTNSTLAGALAAAKLHIPIAHVEAGLRSYNRKMPEEINRIIADQLSHVLFTPTKKAVENLMQEGYPSAKIVEVGDVMYDAALYYGNKASKQSHILTQLDCKERGYILATIHRAENTDDHDNLRTIFHALENLCDTMRIIMPLHPRTKKILENIFPELLKKTKINIIDPLGFLDMVMLEKHAALIITDSGGVQKEAFFYGVPCVTLRTETEWVETVELGWNKLVSPKNGEIIHSEVLNSIGSTGTSNQHPYGNGKASTLIASHLAKGM